MDSLSAQVQAKALVRSRVPLTSSSGNGELLLPELLSETRRAVLMVVEIGRKYLQRYCNRLSSFESSEWK